MISARFASSAMLAVLAVLVGALGCAQLPGAARVDGNHWQQSYALAGETGPVVVFESGLGDGKEAWASVFAPVSAFARPLAYDRAGYGASRSDAHSRDPETVVAELRRLLAALELPPPYVLVGHSIGGPVRGALRAAPFPKRSPVWCSSTCDTSNYSKRCVEEGLERCEVSPLMRWLMPEHMVGEIDGSRRGEAAIPFTRAAFPRCRSWCSRARQRANSSDALKRVWAETQADLVNLSPYARQEICETCGHYVQDDAPELVIDAIRSLVP